MPYLLHICTCGLHVGCCPPQPVSVLGPVPTLSPTFLLAQAIFKPNLSLYKHPNILYPVILGLAWLGLAWLGLIQSFYSHLPSYEDETDNAPKRRHIKFRRRGITQKKAYNSLVNNCITVVSFNSTLSKPIIQGVLVNL